MNVFLVYLLILSLLSICICQFPDVSVWLLPSCTKVFESLQWECLFSRSSSLRLLPTYIIRRTMLKMYRLTTLNIRTSSPCATQRLTSCLRQCGGTVWLGFLSFLAQLRWQKFFEFTILLLSHFQEPWGSNTSRQVGYAGLLPKWISRARVYLIPNSISITFTPTQ
jgi:hypothetical protein